MARSSWTTWAPNGFDEQQAAVLLRAGGEQRWACPGTGRSRWRCPSTPATCQGVTVTPTDLTVAEDGGAATYTVALTAQPPAPVTIIPSTDDPKVATVETARPDNALVFGPGDWSIPQTVTVTGVNDDIDNPQNRRGTAIRHSVVGRRLRQRSRRPGVRDGDRRRRNRPQPAAGSNRVSEPTAGGGGRRRGHLHRVAEQPAQRGRGGYRQRRPGQPQPRRSDPAPERRRARQQRHPAVYHRKLGQLPRQLP